jgi:hypothetical protein
MYEPCAPAETTFPDLTDLVLEADYGPRPWVALWALTGLAAAAAAMVGAMLILAAAAITWTTQTDAIHGLSGFLMAVGNG